MAGLSKILRKNRGVEISQVSLDDRFAAQIVYATGRCPPMYRLVTDCRSFHCQFNQSYRSHRQID